MRGKYATLALMTAVLLSACHSTIEDPAQETSESEASSESAETASDESEALTLPDVVWVGGMTCFQSLTGEVLLDSSNGLTMLDLSETGAEPVYVCANVGCKHTNADSCTAAFMSLASFPVIYEGNIYGIVSSESSLGVYSCKTDGTDLTKVYDLGYSASATGGGAIRAGNMLYYMILNETSGMDDDGYAVVEDSCVTLYQTNLLNGDTTPVYEFSHSYGSNGIALFYSDGYIGAEVSLQTKSIEEAGYTQKEYVDAMTTGGDWESMYEALEVKSQYVLINEEDFSGDIIDIGEGYSLLGVADESLLAVKTGDRYICGFKTDGSSYEWKTTDTVEAVSVENISCGLLLSYYQNNEKKYVYYPYTGEEPVEITVPGTGNFLVVDDGTDYVYIAITPEGDSTSDEWEYVLVDKSELLSGQLEWRFWGEVLVY